MKRLAALFEESQADLRERPGEGEARWRPLPLGPVPAGMDAVELAAWTMVGNVLMNLDESLMKR